MPRPDAPFSPRRERDIADLIAANPLAWVISPAVAESAATLLPLLAECDDDGRVVALFGHFARANRQVEILERDPRALILFQGPQAYVAPKLVSKPDWGPTWNYASAWFETELRFVPEETHAAVDRLAAALEAKEAEPWTTERMGERMEGMLRAIVAFRARVIERHAVFKVGQDESPRIFDEIVEGIDDPDLARLMADQHRGSD